MLRAIRILIADDHPHVRAALREMLDERPEVEVVGEAGDGMEALELSARLDPDVVVMDVMMPRMGGVEATRRLQAARPSILVIGFSTDVRSSQRHPIEVAGAVAYHTKDSDAFRLVETLLSIHAARVLE